MIIIMIIIIILAERETPPKCVFSFVPAVSCCSRMTCLRDKDLYTTTNKCLQCLIKITYTVF